MKLINLENLLAIGMIALIILMAFSFKNEKITVYLIGDSTMSIKEAKAFPETGWGVPFAGFFDSRVHIENRAKNGRSTRTFMEEGSWQAVISSIKEGDYLFIQFGHNDESVEKTDRYTDPEQYVKNLITFVSECRAKQAHPILISPVGRRKFINGLAQETHPVYSELVKKTAAELEVPFIGLDVMSRELYQSMGEEKSKLLFLQLRENEHPNYPEGKTDNTHFNELGARLIAQLVLKELRAQSNPLCEYIIKRD